MSKSLDEILGAIAEWSVNSPDRLAVADLDVSLSYRTLAQASDFVASALAAHGLKPGDMTVFMGSNGAQRAVAYLGFLKAGVTTLFLDPRNPPETWREWANHADPIVLIRTADCADLGQGLGGLPAIDLPMFGMEELPRVPPVIGLHPPDLVAYITFTSGSTGKPKGVPMRRCMVALNVELASKTICLSPGERTGITGQVWTEMILAPLAAGASVHNYDFARLGASGLSDWLADQQINVFSTYTAAARALEIGPKTQWPELRMFRMAGEPLLRADVERLAKALPTGSLLENSFGLSEYAWISGYCHAIGDPIQFDGMPLGYAYEPERFLLLGEDGVQVAPYEQGEIAIRSPCTIDGYWKDPERSERVLKRLPPSDEDFTFFTGDYGYMDESGLIWTAGRADEQVKIRGYNVRPTEIEAVLSQKDGLREIAIVSFVAPNGIRRLACHYIAATEADGERRGEPVVSAAALREFLKSKVPAYMVPGQFIPHEEFPRTRTGKIDRKALPSPLAHDAGDTLTVAGPRTKTEELLFDIWADVWAIGSSERRTTFSTAAATPSRQWRLSRL